MDKLEQQVFMHMLLTLAEKSPHAIIRRNAKSLFTVINRIRYSDPPQTKSRKA